MKKLIALLLSLVLCVGALVGCGNNTSSGGGNTGNNGSGGNDNAGAGNAGNTDSTGGGGTVTHDTLTVALSREPATLIPHESNDTGTAPVTHQYCESLLTTDLNGDLQPCLAESWEQIDDTHYRFNLRQGVKFHDGSDFTAEDVLYTMEKCLASTATAAAVGPIDIANSVIEDDHTLVVALTETCPAFLNFCSLDIMGIVSKSAMEADPEGYAASPVGTGPFQFVEWATGDHVLLKANPDWWGGDIAFENLMLRIIPEATTRAIEVESGNTDLANITITDVPNIAANPDVVLINQPILNTSFLSFNCSVAPFDNVKVRQAISLAVDADAIVNAIYGEYSSVAKSFLSPTTWGYYEAESDYSGYNPERAKELLAEAGYSNGFSCTMVSNGNQAMAELIQSYLGEVGIDLTLNVTDFANWLDALVNGKQEMYIGGWTVPSGDASEAFDYFDSANFGAGGNRSFYANSEADALIAIIDTETDIDTRYQACVDLQELLADECVTIGLNVGYTYWAQSGNVDNFVVLSTQSPNFANITFKN